MQDLNCCCTVLHSVLHIAYKWRPTMENRKSLLDEPHALVRLYTSLTKFRKKDPSLFIGTMFSHPH